MSIDIQMVASYEGDYTENLFYKKYSTWNEECHSNMVYVHIIRNLRRYSISNSDFLQDASGNPCSQITMYVPQFPSGNYINSIVVKKLVSTDHVYEIRINTTYFKERILFYPFKSQSSIVLSFYFEKQNGSDLTDILAKETEEIYLGNINSETI
ncbi:hypothetical protein [Streptococcus orisratti]|uniref:hypothetical protein n=1 Tax=Streptococcus orisratti TaxID=114652 RepID=UPI003D080F4F